MIARIWDKVMFLWNSVKSPEIPLALKVTVIEALLYLILPLDEVPKAIEKARIKIQESYYAKIDFKLKEIFYHMLLNSVITFVINITGIVILIFKPVREYSKFIAVGFFFNCVYIHGNKNCFVFY